MNSLFRAGLQRIKVKALSHLQNNQKNRSDKMKYKTLKTKPRIKSLISLMSFRSPIMIYPSCIFEFIKNFIISPHTHTHTHTHTHITYWMCDVLNGETA